MTMVRALILTSFVMVAPLAFAGDCPTGTGVWCSGAYTYDGAGNIKAIGSDSYRYDAFGRLVSGSADVQHNHAGVQSYTYDEFGNRGTTTRSAGATNCIGPCELDVTIGRTTNHITDHGATYDDAGNLLTIDTATYSYDAASMLTRATVGSDDREFLYTADDERLATKQGETWTWTVRGLDDKVLREITSNGPDTNRQWAKDYVWRSGQLLASITPTFPGASTTITQHYHLDHLGTPRVVTNDNGAQIGVHAYYPFGAELDLTPRETTPELMKFTGHERDQLASDAHTLDAMHARYDVATMGRFLSVDHVKPDPELPQNWNRYTYALNNPVRFVDPDGRQFDSGWQMRRERDQLIKALGPVKGEQAYRGVVDDSIKGGVFGLLAVFAAEASPVAWRGLSMALRVGYFQLSAALSSATSVMLGQNMARVRDAANGLGALTFEEEAETSAAQWELNRRWIDEAIKCGYRIVDIGRDPNKVTSARTWLTMEQDYLQSQGFQRVHAGWMFVQGQLTEVFEWVAKK